MSDAENTSAGSSANCSPHSQQGGESASKSRRIRVTGARGKEEDPQLLELFAAFGSVLKIERHSHQDGVLVVAMETVEEANAAVAALGGREFDGAALSLNNTAAGQQRWQQTRRGAAQPAAAQSHDAYPLRLLVQSEHVGTIIGKGGAKIKEITASSGARIDVRRQFTQGPSAGRQIVDCQTVHITGTPEACSRACKEILSVANPDANEVELSLLAENRFCGRVIGKDGKNLKAVRDKTKTAIQLSHSPVVTAFELGAGGCSSDRIVTIRGSLADVCEAEAQVSEILRQGHRAEAPQRGGGPPIGAAYGAAAYRPAAYGQGAYGPGAYGQAAYGQAAYGQAAYGGAAYGAAAYGGAGCAPGWPYVTFTALDPGRKFKKVAVKATM